MKKTVLMMLTVAMLAAGQQTDAERKALEAEKKALAERQGPPRVQKVFQVKHANVDSLWAAFNHIADIRVNKELKLLVVNGSAEAIKAIEDALKTLDIPPPAIKNVEMTFHMILAKPNKNGALPQSLEAVQKNLEGLFGFKGFHLLETAQIRVRDGARAQTNGSVPNPYDADANMKVRYSLEAVPTVATSEKGNMIRIDNLKLSLDVPMITGTDPFSKKATFNESRANIQTQIDVREGQRVVVGKANVNASDGAMVLVVTAKVVD